MKFIFWVFAFFNSTTAFSNKLAPRTLKTFARITSSKADVIDDVSVLNSTKDCGAIPPLGFWDPLGITNNTDERLFNYMREAEQHHGRVAMLTSVVLPCLDLFDNDDLAIDSYQKHPSEIAFASFMMYEIVRMLVQYDKPSEKLFRLKEDVFPGNTFKYDVSKVSQDLVNKELSNGRLAMFASLGYMLQELVSQQKIFTSV